ncbi:Outer membrane porin protein [Paraburkholderia caffeinitolerans]|uniref:Outer membrane porin protein n=1 Tax=Paraburkholderia caffeinitolerans TaxID=1723730 RepID=A0A6J5GMS0_9BURK|nr:porin [Paraburkholderia caffeinitolerans]CAB3803708.1 Outer membrane porin protein [Paraburkholderia caffeinitolerans]
MRKRLSIIAVLVGSPTLCSAQSHVGIYGILDTGFAYVSNQQGNRAWKAQSSNLSGDRWGLLGAEDLGGGTQAVFRLENGFDINSGKFGQGNREFGRQAYIGLKNSEYGALTFGRQYESVLDFVGFLSSASAWASIVGAHVGNIDDLAPAFRVNNSIKYTSNNYYGLTFGGLYALSNQPGAFSNNRAWSVGTRYVRGALAMGAGYFRLDNPDAAGTAGAIGGSGSGTNSDYGGTAGLALLGGSGVIRRHQVFAAGGSYSIGHATVGLLFSHTEFDASINSARADNYEINCNYQISPQLRFGTAYIYTNGHNDQGGHPRYQQVNLGVDYFLSKRTDLYAIGLYQHASGDARYATLYTQPSSSGNLQTSVIAGVRHRF